MTIEEIRRRKIELGFSNQQLAELSGVPIGTLQKIIAGSTQAPRRDTLLAIEKVLWPDTDKPRTYDAALQKAADRKADSGMHEAAVPYGKKLYTLEDYLALPDDQRVELIDGVFYDMAAPMTWHQAIGGFIHKLLMDHVLEHGGKCKPFMSPVDVQLDCDDKTVVQPDVLIVCDLSKFQNGRVFGAPDFVVEVLSKSTRKKDMQLKLYKYANAGVREYWMIDPKKKVTMVYDLEHEEFPVLYGERDRIPVRIWNGECEIDMGKVFDWVEFLYEE